MNVDLTFQKKIVPSLFIEAFPTTSINHQVCANFHIHFSPTMDKELILSYVTIILNVKG